MATEGGGISEEEEGEHEGDTVPETPVPVILRQCTVLHPDTRECDQDYPVGLFEVEPIEGLQAVAIILVAELDHRLVVAFPDTAWHRSVARRQLSSGAFQKPISVQVDFTDRSLGAPENTFPHKVWLGILAPEFEDKVLFGPDELEEPDIIFASGGPQVLPTADSLVAAFETHFFFSSAVSGGDKPAAASRRTSAVDQRLQRLEETVLTLVDSVKKLVPAEAAPLPKRQSALRAPGTQWPSPPPRVQLPEGADSEVVRAARAAGVSEEDIMEMARLAAQGKPKLTDLPRPRTKANQKNALSEGEDEDNEVEQLGEAGQHSEGASSHLEKAVVRLTEIAGHLAKEKKKDKSLEALLDGVGSGGAGDSSTPAGGRKHVAALRALRKTLVKNPQQIADAVERNMEEDFQMRTQIPGSDPVRVTARAWLEMRSRVQGFQTPVRFLWGIAGVLDAIRDDNIPQARARCGLLLAMGDQMSIDRGLWLVAGEMSLEDPPPLGAFHSHQLPTDSEAPHTRLVDGRWVDLFLQKLADFDQLQEKKRKLTFKRNGKGGEPTSSSEAALAKQPGPKKNPKGKGKNKDASGGGSAEPPLDQ